MHSNIKTLVAVALGALVSVSCSKETIEAPGIEANSFKPSVYNGPTQKISFAATLGFDANKSKGEARALEGSVFYRGRLRPKITNGQVSVLVYLGSKALNKFSSQEVLFQYDEETNTIHYRGEITVPEGLLGANDLKMLLVAANASKISGTTLKMTGDKTAQFIDKGFADGETLTVDAPYFSDWLDVTKYVDGNLLDVARSDKNILLRPQGHIIKMELNSSVTALQDISLEAYRIESNVITDKGRYALPTDVNGIGVDPVFTPELAQPNNNLSVIDITLPQPVLVGNTTKTLYIWVENMNLPNTTKAWTRAFTKVQLLKPILDPTFVGRAWWHGYGLNGEGQPARKRFPVYYTNSRFEQTGSTMSMHLDNAIVTSPINRMSYTYASQTFSDSYSTGENGPLALGEWRQREWTGYMNYSWPWLAGQNYVGTNPQDIMFPNAPEANSRTVKFRVPTIEELAAIIPTQSVGSVFQSSYSNQRDITVQERVKLDNRQSAPLNYEASYKHYPNYDGANNAVIGVRFKGGNNRYKTIYMYRVLQPGSDGVARTQIQTYYAGAFYPEITTPQDFKDFERNYPGATKPGDENTEERVLPVDRRHWGSFKGVNLWVNNADAQNATYVHFNITSNAQSVEVRKVPVSDATTYNTLLLVRDL